MGWSRTLLLSSLLLACGRSDAVQTVDEVPVPAEGEPVAEVFPEGPRPQPKPGERVRQPELDPYCIEDPRPIAYYYHGGAPVRRVARKDRCTPLYITECESSGHCYPPRDQEPGMWCCGQSTPAGGQEPQQQARR
ncbi:MAG: hypothetical protein OXT09_31335 [Myxococcales bacterium]|nr:hypothetical protein [Myxococcales bacterium]